MKPRNRLLPAAVMALLAGCATFTHQTGEAEPHAVLRFTELREFPDDFRVIQAVDGLPVSTFLRNEYRVRPGVHELVYRDYETVTESTGPMQAGLHFGSGPRAAVSPVTVGHSEITGRTTVDHPVDPFAQQALKPVSFSHEGRRSTTITNSLTLEAGWLYETDGYSTERRRIER